MIGLDHAQELVQLVGGEPDTVGQRHGIEPELCQKLLTLDVNVAWLAIFVRIEEKTIGADTENCWQHAAIMPQQNCPRGLGGGNGCNSLL